MSEATEQKRRRDPGTGRRVLALAVTTALVVLAVLAFAYRDRLSAEGLRGLFSSGAEAPGGDAFAYEPGSAQVFAAAGNGLAAASASSVELFDGSGRAVYKKVVAWSTPAVFASDTGALFCDLGGTEAVAADFGGDAHVIAAEGEILTAARSENGWAALTTAEPGSKALVSVYDPYGTLRYRWWSGSGYVLRACVSPNGRLLAALCAENGGGRLHLFRLDDETELASADFSGALPFDLAFLDGDSLCAVSSGALYFLGTDGVETGRWSFDGYLTDYDLGGDGFAAVCVSPTLSGGAGTLTALGAEGAVLGEAPLERAPLSLSAAGKRLLVADPGGLELFDRSLRSLQRRSGLTTAYRALLRSDGRALLLGAYSAELITLNS